MITFTTLTLMNSEEGLRKYGIFYMIAHQKYIKTKTELQNQALKIIKVLV